MVFGQVHVVYVKEPKLFAGCENPACDVFFRCAKLIPIHSHSLATESFPTPSSSPLHALL